jgi:hypothetical protein
MGQGIDFEFEMARQFKAKLQRPDGIPVKSVLRVSRHLFDNVCLLRPHAD